MGISNDSKYRISTEKLVNKKNTLKNVMHHFVHQKPGNSPNNKTLKYSPRPKKAKTVSSAGNIMATIFWDSHGIADYLEKENNKRRILVQFVAAIERQNHSKK